jgi:hypothetical protein
MRLPKWVVKWVKDNFDVDALELKCRQQEEKIKKLTNEIARLKWNALLEEEREWALNAFFILTWKLFPWSEQTAFIEKYVKLKEEWDAAACCFNDDLPFDD